MSKVSMKVYTAEENKNIDAKKYRKQKMKFIIQHLWLEITMSLCAQIKFTKTDAKRHVFHVFTPNGPNVRARAAGDVGPAPLARSGRSPIWAISELRPWTSRASHGLTGAYWCGLRTGWGPQTL
jgi:hypothetical protein